MTNFKDFLVNIIDIDFFYDQESWKITSTDKEIWVDLLGFKREGPEEFILNLKGKKVGFCAPESDSDWIATRPPAQSSYTIDKVGIGISRWIGDDKNEYCIGYEFKDLEDVKEVVSLISKAMHTYKVSPNLKSDVYFSKGLLTFISNEIN
jgi:hypothetical protein